MAYKSGTNALFPSLRVLPPVAQHAQARVRACPAKLEIVKRHDNYVVCAVDGAVTASLHWIPAHVHRGNIVAPLRLTPSVLLLERQVPLKRFANGGDDTQILENLNGGLPPNDALWHHQSENHSLDPLDRRVAPSRRPQKMHKMRDKTGKAIKTKEC